MKKDVLEIKIKELIAKKGSELWAVHLTNANELARIASENNYNKLKDIIIKHSVEELDKAKSALGNPYFIAPFLKTEEKELEEKLNNINLDEYDNDLIQRKNLRNLLPTYFPRTDLAKYLETRKVLHVKDNLSYSVDEIKKYIETIEKLNAELIWPTVVDDFSFETGLSKPDIRRYFGKSKLVKDFPLGNKTSYFQKDKRKELIKELSNFEKKEDDIDELVRRKKISDYVFNLDTYENAIWAIEEEEFSSREFNIFANIVSHAGTEYNLNELAARMFSEISQIYNITFSGLEEVSSVHQNLPSQTVDRLMNIAECVKDYLKNQKKKITKTD